MHRAWRVVLLLVAGALPVGAQIGQQVIVRAGTPEDRALNQITRTADPAQKLALIQKFIVDFGSTDSILLGYDLLMEYHLEAKEFDKVFEVGGMALARDPENFTAAYRMFRAGQGKGDSAQMFAAGERIAGILERFAKSSPPADSDPAGWEERRELILEEVQSSVTYIEYALFTLAYQSSGHVQRGELLERFAESFPASPYAANARANAAASFQMAQDVPRMAAFAGKMLERHPHDVQMLLLLADTWSERGEELDKAEEYATRGLKELESAEKPAHLTDEQWAEQKTLQIGLLHSALGQVHLHRNRNAEAVEVFQAAAPLLRSDSNALARNQYRLGHTLARMNRLPEARAALLEAVAIEGPYKELAQKTLSQIGPAPRPKKRP